MKKHLIIIFSVAVLLITGNLYGDENVYYCVETDNNGFHYDEKSKKYKPSKFHTNKFKMKLEKENNSIELAFDNKKEFYYCQPNSIRPELMSCLEILGIYSFNFNVETGRFVYSKSFGYVGGDGDSIHVSYGKCDQF